MPDTLSAAFRFVLVEPRFAGNIGSAARVLKNFGFGRLDIVSPRGGPIEDEAFRMALESNSASTRSVDRRRPVRTKSAR